MITSDTNPEKLIRRFLAEKDITDATKKVYEYCIRKFFVFLVVSGYNTRKVTAPMILAFKKDLKQKEVSALYVNLCLNVLRSFFRWQVGQGIRRHNIAKNVRVEPVIKRHRRGVLSETEIKQLLQSIDQSDVIGTRDFTLLMLAYTNGLRAIELSRLSLKHIDLEKKRIQIRGKGIYDLVVADLAEAAAGAIEALIQKRVDEGESINQESALFTGYSVNPQKRNGRISANSISKLIAKRMKAAGVKHDRITSHSLRHSAAVHLIAKGASLHLVSLFLRHSSVKITEIYTHHSQNRMLSEQKPSEMLTKAITNPV